MSRTPRPSTPPSPPSCRTCSSTWRRAPFVPAAAADPAGAFTVNTLGTLHVLAAAARHAPRCRVLVVGSADVYGVVPDAAQPIA